MFEPEFLREGYNNLLELSDLAFSTGRFVKNFSDEEQSSFTFNLDDFTQLKVLSYSFNLDRPDARGGAENLILKIMLTKDIFPLISQFTLQIKSLISQIHKHLNEDINGKEKEFVKKKNARN